MKHIRAFTAFVIVVVLVAGLTGAQAAQVTVTVTDKDNGAQLHKAVVAVVVGSSVVAAGRTAADGTWSARVPDANKATVVVAKSLYASVARQVALSGQVTVNLALKRFASDDFSRVGRIVGFVRDSAGQPLPNATLVLLRGTTPVGVTQPQNATGIYELKWYPPGTYTVLATAPGHAPKTYQGQRITAGESLWLDVTLAKKQ